MPRKKQPPPSWFRFNNIVKVLIVVVITIIAVREIQELLLNAAPGFTTENRTTPCTEPALDEALAAGEPIVLTCETPIRLTTTKRITQDTVIAGVGITVTIDGQNQVENIFQVEDGAQFTLRDIELINSTRIGVLVDDGTFDAVNCFFRGHGSERGDGAAIWNAGGTVRVESCTFEDNDSWDDGAAIVNSSGTLEVVSSFFRRNAVGTQPDGSGAALYNKGTAEVYNSVFEENNARNGFGAAIANHSGRLTVTGSQFRYNQAGADGGAIYNASGAEILITGSTFLSNRAARGGAVYNAGGMRLEDNTFDANIEACYNSGSLAQSGSQLNCGG